MPFPIELVGTNWYWFPIAAAVTMVMAILLGMDIHRRERTFIDAKVSYHIAQAESKAVPLEVRIIIILLLVFCFAVFASLIGAAAAILLRLMP